MALRRDLFARTTQPQGEVGLDPDHWLTPWVRQGVIAGPARNATNQYRLTAVTAPQKGAVGQPGVVLDLAGSSGYAAAPSVADATAWSYISFGLLRSGAALCAVATMAELPGSTTSDRSLMLTSGNQVQGNLYDGASTKAATTTTSLSVGTPSFIAAIATGSAVGAYCKGELATTAAANSGYTAYASPEFVVGWGQGGFNTSSQWSTYYTLLIRRALTLAELRELEENPWAIFTPDTIEWMLSTGGGGISGSITKTLGAVTSSSAAKVTVAGVVTKTLDSVTSTSAAKVALKGATTKTLGAVTSTSAAKAAIKGTTTKTLADATLAASGASQTLTTGAVAKTLDNVTSTSAAKVAIKGTTTKTLGNVTSSAAAKVALKGTTTKTLASLSLASTGAGQVIATGALSKTLDGVTAASAAKLAIVAATSKSLGALTSAAAAKVALRASLSKALAAATLSSTATALSPVQGSLAKTLAALSMSATGVQGDLVYGDADGLVLVAADDRAVVVGADYNSMLVPADDYNADV